MNMTKIALAAVLAMGAASANAAGYVGFDAGFASIDQKSLVDVIGQSLANASTHTVTATYDTGTSAGRIFAGLPISEALDLEIGYLSFGDLDATYTGTTTGGTPFSVKTALSASGFDFAAVYWPSKNWFVKGGFHNLEVEGNLTASVSGSSATYGLSASGTGLLVGVGYEAEGGKDMNWRAAYSYYDSLGGMSDANAHVFSVGLKAKF